MPYGTANSIFTMIRYFIEIKLSKIVVFTFGPVDHTKQNLVTFAGVESIYAKTKEIPFPVSAKIILNPFFLMTFFNELFILFLFFIFYIFSSKYRS